MLDFEVENGSFLFTQAAAYLGGGGKISPLFIVDDVLISSTYREEGYDCKTHVDVSTQ